MIKTTYRRQGEGVFPFDYYTKHREADGSVTLKGWGRYGRSSVLAGQSMKQFIDSFPSEAELNAALVEAGIFPAEVEWSSKWVEPQNTFDHLSDGSDW